MRNCDHTSAGSSGGRSRNWAVCVSSWVISTVPRMPSWRLAKRAGIRSRDLRWYDWREATSRWPRHPSGTPWTVPGTVPSKELPPNTDLRRAPLLAAQVEIEVAAGDLLVARDAADELARVAATFQSKALVASAAMADGRVRLAVDDTSGARQAFQTAVELWGLVGAPHETALARTCLAETDRVAGADVRDQRDPVHSARRSNASTSPTSFTSKATIGLSPSKDTRWQYGT